jgi:hypothetical protein
VYQRYVTIELNLNQFPLGDKKQLQGKAKRAMTKRDLVVHQDASGLFYS